MRRASNQHARIRGLRARAQRTKDTQKVFRVCEEIPSVHITSHTAERCFLCGCRHTHRQHTRRRRRHCARCGGTDVSRLKDKIEFRPPPTSRCALLPLMRWYVMAYALLLLLCREERRAAAATWIRRDICAHTQEPDWRKIEFRLNARACVRRGLRQKNTRTDREAKTKTIQSLVFFTRWPN